MLSLRTVQGDVQRVAEAIAVALGVDVEITDRDLIRVAGTGEFSRQLGNSLAGQGRVHAHVLQIGARNMQNYRLLEEAGATDRPVLLKRGPAASLDELLLAAEYVLNAGNQNVILCERGIRTFETHTRYTLPLASVPYLHDRTHLPVVVDPSHGTGHTQLVAPMAVAAVAAGADGLILEVHHDPAHAAKKNDLLRVLLEWRINSGVKTQSWGEAWR